MANTARVNLALKGVLKLAHAIPTKQKKLFEDLFAAYIALLRDPSVSNKECFMLGSFTKIAGEGFMQFAQSFGTPSSSKRNGEDLSYAITQLTEAGYLKTPKKPTTEPTVSDTGKVVHPTNTEINKMTKKPLVEYCLHHFGVELDPDMLGDSMRDELRDLIANE